MPMVWNRRVRSVVSLCRESERIVAMRACSCASLARALLKYRPDLADRFPSLPAARRWLRHFFHWYHTEHRHSGLGWLTPAVVHRGEGPAVRQHRAAVLAAAYARHSERYGAGPPQPPALLDHVAINPPEDPP